MRKGQVALVTGAASGIGKALSQALWQAGAEVVMLDLNSEGLKVAKAEIAPDGERISTFELNVSQSKAFEVVVNTVFQRFGRIDYLFNNAGVGLAGEVRDLDTSDWKRMIDINLWGVIYGIQAIYPLMIQQGFGHIINTASGAGILPRPGMTPYAMAKHGVLGLSISLRGEAAALGVHVSAVCPGFIATNILKSTTYKNVDMSESLAKVPIAPMSADTCAQQILKGVRKNKAIIPITKITRLEWLLYRLFPELMINRVGRIRAQAFQKNRVST